MRNLNKQLGVNLIELMIALLISTFLLGAAVSVLVRNQTDYTPLRDLVRVNDGFRASLDFMRADIERAGVMGESFAFGDEFVTNAFFNNIVNVNNPDEWSSLWYVEAGQSSLEGVEGSQVALGWLPSGAQNFDPDNSSLDSTVLRDVLYEDVDSGSPMTDAITIRGTWGGTVNRQSEAIDMGVAQPLTQNYVQGTNLITLNTTQTFPSQSRHFIIYNSKQADIFEGTVQDNTIVISPDNLGGDISRDYEIAGSSLGPAFVTPLSFTRYYVALDEDNEPTLYREQSDGNGGTFSAPMLTGVENMQIAYQEVTNPVSWTLGDFVPANEIENMDRVVAVKIGLLIRSETQSGAVVGLSDGNYDLAGTVVTVASNDRYLRRAFNLVINLKRNIS